MRLVPAQRATDHVPFWGKEFVRTDFKLTNLSIKDYCIKFGGADHWRRFYSQIWKWRKLDPEFNAIIEAALTRNGMREKRSGGRPSLEETQPTWREDFCAALKNCNGNRAKASRATPYSFKTITQKLDPNYTSYDKEFKEMVRATELEIAARAEELLNAAALEFEDSEIGMDRAKVLDIQARIAEKVVSKMDHERWGKRVDMKIEGTIQHKLIPQGERIAKLMQEQREIFIGKGQSIPLALPEKTDVVEGEVIEEDASLRE